MTEKRKLYKIAHEIKSDWKNMSIHAKPYLDAMSQLGEVTDRFGLDDGDDIVRRFLANAQTWRGEKAREIKKELNALLK